MYSTRILGSAAVLVVATGAWACATSGGGQGTMSWDMGLSTATDAQQKALQIFQQYHYEIERHEEPPSIYIITRWRSRTPFQDERRMGVVEARTRFVLEARPRSRSLESDPSRDHPDPYSVRLRTENEGRIQGEPDFTLIETTPEFREYADRLAGDLKTVLAMGIRIRMPQ